MQLTPIFQMVNTGLIYAQSNHRGFKFGSGGRVDKVRFDSASRPDARRFESGPLPSPPPELKAYLESGRQEGGE